MAQANAATAASTTVDRVVLFIARLLKAFKIG